MGVFWNPNTPLRQGISEFMETSSHPNCHEFFACAVWNIWKERNDLIFKGVVPSIHSCRRRTKQDLLLHQFRVKAARVQPLLDRIVLFFG